eukprot:Gb_25917 [translate_table: standard]
MGFYPMQSRAGRVKKTSGQLNGAMIDARRNSNREGAKDEERVPESGVWSWCIYGQSF